jgi:hypothetical protein
MRTAKPLPELAERELERCCLEGLNSKQTRLRLLRCGVAFSDRTIYRYVAKFRSRQARAWQLQQLGIGAASIHADLGAVADVVRNAAPEWRAQQRAVFCGLVEEFLQRPTAVSFTALVVAPAGHAFIVSATLAESLGAKNA